MREERGVLRLRKGHEHEGGDEGTPHRGGRLRHGGGRGPTGSMSGVRQGEGESGAFLVGHGGRGALLGGDNIGRVLV